MRTEQEMYQLILDTAREDDRILAVYMNGSRTNEKAVKDIFQDYDVVYVVTETSDFIRDKSWIDRFGERLYMQYPDEGPGSTPERERFYGWLMQFADGNRLDLHVETLEHAREHIQEDRLCKILLDKEACLPPMPPATDEDHWVKRPSEEEFQACCNEFWWCLNNVAKGLWREEIPYVQDMVNLVVRKELTRLLAWKIGCENNFRVSIGKSGKYMYRFLTKAEWQQYLSTYFGANTEEAWEAVMEMCSLFEQTAKFLGMQMNYHYNAEEGKNSRGFLERVRSLPKDAAEI